jgi:hypothetical protein
MAYFIEVPLDHGNAKLTQQDMAMTATEPSAIQLRESRITLFGQNSRISAGVA